jgi:putative phosphotransacetylase
MENKILVETSARHVHLTVEDLATLFGPDAKLTEKKQLSQPGQYACNERVDVVGPKKTLTGVSILGPTRKATQIEISATDARSIGIVAPVRDSGDVKESAPCTLVGPKGSVELKEGVIIAKRHIHFSPEEAKEFDVVDGEIVQVKIKTEERSLIFDDVLCRVNKAFSLAMHIDIDESNAAGCAGTVYGELIKK